MKRKIIESAIILILTLFILYLLSGLVLTSAGYPMWWNMNKVEYETTIIIKVTPRFILRVFRAYFTGKKLSITHTFDRNPMVVKKWKLYY